MSRSANRKPKHVEAGPLSSALLPGLVAILVDVRPSWEPSLVAAVLSAHREQVDAPALVRAAIDAADDPDVYDPRAIGWSLRRSTSTPIPRCATCSLPADQCARRPGRDDDHPFVEAVRS